MTLTQSARIAYGRPEAPARTARTIEYDLIARVTQRLTTAAKCQAVDFPAFAAALHENTLMWRTLAADVADPGNGLPAPLRAQLFYLYEFTAEHGRKVLAKEAGIEVLVDINTAVMRGLRGEGGAS
ncbi:MAG TPA: flagellar biosynthesis regulator FlaF [Paracoccaceae bacterium]